jgi:hypothetical protein
MALLLSDVRKKVEKIARLGIPQKDAEVKKLLVDLGQLIKADGQTENIPGFPELNLASRETCETAAAITLLCQSRYDLG